MTRKNRIVLGVLATALWTNTSAFAADLDRRTAVVDAVAKVRDAVLNLRTMRVVPAKLEESERGGRVRGLGTGVLVDPRGYVVTNYHVVEKVDQIQALTSKGREYPARVVNFDEKADLAVLKIDAAEKFSFVPLHGAGEPILGETVIAIGNPWGLENTVTTGIVSAVNRELRLPNEEFFDDLIQTDASINPGNSGGPLMNINGDLLGVNVAIRSNAQRIGFAIPVRKVRRVVEEMLGAPPISMANQGLVLREEDGAQVTQNTKASSLLRVAKVEPGSQAQKLGFREGDELFSVAGEDVRVRFDLHRALWDRRFGDVLDFTVRRNGKEMKTLSLTMQPPIEPTDEEVLWQKLGIRVRQVPAERVKGVNSQWRGGLLILQVAPQSPAARADFQPGDILAGLGGWETISPNNVRFVMQWKELAQNQPIVYHLLRDGAVLPERTMQMPTYP